MEMLPKDIRYDFIHQILEYLFYFINKQMQYFKLIFMFRDEVVVETYYIPQEDANKSEC